MFHSIPSFPQKSSDDQTKVEVRIGLDEPLKTFMVDKKVLCSTSEYCRRRLAPDSPKKGRAVTLKGYEPLAFEMFLDWNSDPAPEIEYDPDGLPQEPWLSSSASAWLLGRKLQCSYDFDKYALSQFIQCCAFMLFGPWANIEKATATGSLRRFSDHWVAWNCQFAGSGPNEYSELRAARKSVVSPVTDPRTYDIEHWYSECGKYMRPECLHDPSTRFKKIEEAKRPKPLPPAEWGESTELRRMVGFEIHTTGTQI